ncbi:hypothetical protein [Ornithinimicrobium sediminis]|uniref:hypothetical protein n=1 Tax=Ornithinimicrobium sediminis TaxID=2904603 RepID=UPI001E5D004B|nr:hypothetical protein [Ornithinimicrobium sediminis]MCE0486056.1 hypothetical protein [Ornithinimicrobium sediminis]
MEPHARIRAPRNPHTPPEEGRPRPAAGTGRGTRAVRTRVLVVAGAGAGAAVLLATLGLLPGTAALAGTVWLVLCALGLPLAHRGGPRPPTAPRRERTRAYRRAAAGAPPMPVRWLREVTAPRRPVLARTTPCG